MEGLPDPVKEFIEKSSPAMGEIGFGGVMGYCSGVAFRRVGRAMGVVVGLGFIGVQAAASSGYLNVDWNKIRDDAIKPLDTVSLFKCLPTSTVFTFLTCMHLLSCAARTRTESWTAWMLRRTGTMPKRSCRTRFPVREASRLDSCLVLVADKHCPTYGILL